MADRTSELSAKLETALKKVPPGVVDSSWNKSAAYKNWVAGVRKTINSRRASESQLQGLINAYNNF